MTNPKILIEQWTEFCDSDSTDIREYLNQQYFGEEYEHADTGTYSSYYEKLCNLSKRINAFRQDIIPFIQFFNDDELELYTSIEDIVVFYHMNSLNDYQVGADHMFRQDIGFLIEIYYKTIAICRLKPSVFFNFNTTPKAVKRY